MSEKTTKEGHAYTPGLKIKRALTVQKTRRLPMPGEVFVKPGDAVDFTTPVARMLAPGEPFVINAAQKLGVQKNDLDLYMKKDVGAEVCKDEPICGYNAFFGLMKNWVNSPTDGILETVSDISGQIIIREKPIEVIVDSYLKGKIVDVMENEGAVIEANAAFIQGIFGVGGEAHGEIKMLVDSPSQHLTAEMITPDCKGKILIGGSQATKEALLKAVEVEAAGVVTGGLRDTDLIEMLGFEIGVAITGHEEIGTTIIITEGFGEMEMSPTTFELLKEFEGYSAAINGATQIRAGVMRPEIIIPHDLSMDKPDEGGLSGGMMAGTPVRIIRQPYFGMLGKVSRLIVELQTVQSGSQVRVVEIELEDGGKAVVPRANVEILEM
ncbi:hypothetical protein JXL21_04335 [Candidatus Bathyarchaeota archaeon]|nr:hypothetical protein [Candidatus Bathyarchaeota archaeon]